MASLKDYERKRKRGKTPEPFESANRGNAPIFVVQRHDARRLHYDFRLERAGALASWAVPKGVPLEPGERPPAPSVQEHPPPPAARPPAPARAGPCRRASRSSPASATSPSTSRITRSPTPPSRGRSRK